MLRGDVAMKGRTRGYILYSMMLLLFPSFSVGKVSYAKPINMGPPGFEPGISAV